MTPEQAKAIRALATIIEETVNESGSMGAPSGVMYAALMSKGVSLQVYQQITGMLVSMGRIRQSGDCFYPIETNGRDFAFVDSDAKP